MNIIFLDVDGVINSVDHLIQVYNKTHKTHSGYSYPFDPKCLANLKELVNKTNSYLVISSTWRKNEEGMGILLKTLSKYDLAKSVIGCTPDLGLSRDNEIKKFLSDFQFADLNFVILDNESKMGDLLAYLVHTDTQVGLTSENVQQAIKILRKKD